MDGITDYVWLSILFAASMTVVGIWLGAWWLGLAVAAAMIVFTAIGAWRDRETSSRTGKR